VRQLGFRARLFIILALFAVVPALLLTLTWGGTMTRLLPLLAGKAAWDTVSTTGSRVIAIARDTQRAAADTAAIGQHERALANATTRSRQFELLTENAPSAFVAASLLLLAILTFVAARVAGHLTRQLSRPLDELVAWTGRIARGEPLPNATARGAPEFGLLRTGMQQMATDLEAGRRAALEAERLKAMRETSRQVAHELKNPLTPIRFAVARLRGRVPAELDEAVNVLDVESARLEQMARSFSQFGRLPDGPVAQVDLAELLQAAVRTHVPPGLACDVSAGPGLSVMGRSDALGRAVGNVLLNAVEACSATGRIEVRAASAAWNGGAGVSITVRDNGPGIDPSVLGQVFEPYVTRKAGGTGLGLAIVRQTIEAHGGRVAAESSPGEGTEVRIWLPVAGPGPAEAT
jgi:signal transduction histidine kinase